MLDTFKSRLFCFHTFGVRRPLLMPKAPDPIRILPDPDRGLFSESRTPMGTSDTKSIETKTIAFKTISHIQSIAFKISPLVRGTRPRIRPTPDSQNWVILLFQCIFAPRLLRVWTQNVITLLGDPEGTANIYCKSCNLPNTDTQNHSTDLW